MAFLCRGEILSLLDEGKCGGGAVGREKEGFCRSGVFGSSMCSLVWLQQWRWRCATLG
jgi:hypothetical protein